MSGLMLRRLHQAGFRIVRKAYEADFVVAHSGGCFLVPADLPARQTYMVGLTHWPGKSILRALVEKNWRDFRLHRDDRNTRLWLHKFSWNLIYFWNMPNNIRMLRARKLGDYWRVKRLTLIRNTEDDFCTPDIASLPFTGQLRFIELSGQHDDIWLYPEHYEHIISHDAKRLLAQTGN